MDCKEYVITLLAMIVVLFLSNQNCYGSETRRSTTTLSKEEDMELERQLKILNKPPLKTIRIKSGDIFDCIDIYKQPAFDHPSLKNHKIQMKPDLIHEEASSNEATLSIVKTEFELQSERCPSGTVPIRRTTKEDLINAQFLYNKIKPYHHTDTTYPIVPMPHHFVSIEPYIEGNVYYGGKAYITAQHPTVESDQFSTAQIWIQNGPAEELNSIEFGWAVYPKLSGDNRTRVFGYWTADGYQKTGCFNMLCPGFVQVHPNYTLGSGLAPISIYGGQGYGMFYMVYREPQSGNWWLIDGIDDVKIGYWPKELFTHLAHNASVIRFGGVAGGNPNKPSPPMGFGHLPDYDSRKAGLMHNMKVVDDKGVPVNFDQCEVLRKQDTLLDCYDLQFLGYVDKHVELSMLFGGPGGMCP